MYEGKKGRYVLDTSYVATDINDKLFDFAGLELVSQSTISHGISKLGEVSELANTKKLIVISEVVEEIRIGLDQLNNHRHYFEGKIREMRKDKARKEKAEKLSGEGILEDLEAYSNALFDFVRTISGKDIREGLSEKQAKYHGRIFEMAKKNSQDLDSLYFKRRLEKESPLNTRTKLKTDKKLVAAAYTIARSLSNSFVYVLTTDGKLEELIRRVGREVKINTESQIVSVNPIYKEELVLYPLDEPLSTNPESEFVLEVLE